MGLDVHKCSVTVAVAENGRRGEVRHWGAISHRADAVRNLVEKIGKVGRDLHFCYEAGPCGYGLYRHLKSLGHDCEMVAPSLIPTKAGDRVKSDRRDALSRLLKKSRRPRCAAKMTGGEEAGGAAQ